MQKLLLTLAMLCAVVAFSNVTTADNKKKATKAKAAKQDKKSDTPAAKKTGKKATKEGSKKSAKAGKKKSATAAGPKIANKNVKKGKKGKKGKKFVKKKGKKKGEIANATIPQEEIDKATKNLSSKDPEIVLESIQMLGSSGQTESADPIVELLKTGPRSDITDAALFALGGINSENTVELLIEYLGHRRADARAASLFALEKFSDEKVTKAIEQALRDSDRQVRATAALALGKRGNVESVPILFKAFERGVTDAAISIGQLGNPEDSKRLTTHLGRADIKILLAGFEEFLHRDNFPEEAKLSILNRLFDLAGPEVWRFAVTYKASFPPDTDENENKIYKLVSRMVRQIKDK